MEDNDEWESLAGKEGRGRTPFDDCGNDQISLRDISTALLRDFLVEVGSGLADQDLTGDNLKIVLDQMDLSYHSTEVA